MEFELGQLYGPFAPAHYRYLQTLLISSSRANNDNLMFIFPPTLLASGGALSVST